MPARTTARPPRRGTPQPLTGGPQRFGPYRLEARLAVGTRSELYLAQRAAAEDDRERDSEQEISRVGTKPLRVVVKRLLAHLTTDPDGCALFEREMHFQRAVSHPNVVAVVEAGATDAGEPFLATEYVEGHDLLRLMRPAPSEAPSEASAWPVGVAAFVMGEVLAGLSATHDALDAVGAPLDLLHRDVTPSNIFVSRTGEVKLGDFGLARSARQMLEVTSDGDSRAQDASLMGKFAYLAPEQVAGEPVDARADLFSAATILAELILGKPLFPGTGQLQALLAIRDCKLTLLEEIRARLPEAFVRVLEKALARDPSKRYADAAALARALAPFAFDATTARKDLGARVGTEYSAAIDALPALPPVSRAPAEPIPSTTRSAEDAPALTGAGFDSSVDIVVDLDLDLEIHEERGADDAHLRATGNYPQLEAFVERRNGERTGPWTFARLLEAIATGLIRRGDQVCYVGGTPQPVERIKQLARLLPTEAERTSLPPASQAADVTFSVDLAGTTMVDVLAHMLAKRQTGLLVLERAGRVSRNGGVDEPTEHREVFLLRGRVHHIDVGPAGDTLGDFLVKRGKLARDELNLALAVLPRYGGRIGDTLIALGLVDGVDIFRAIREQGRDRITELFRWQEGAAWISPNVPTPAVDFPLDLDLPTLMLVGMEASHPGESPMAFIEGKLDDTIVPHPRAELATFSWPPLITAVLAAVDRATTLRAVLGTVTQSTTVTASDVVRALEVVLAMDLARWK